MGGRWLVRKVKTVDRCQGDVIIDLIFITQDDRPDLTPRLACGSETMTVVTWVAVIQVVP